MSDPEPDPTSARPAAAARADRRGTIRLIVRLAGPAISQQLLHTLLFLVDRGMLGRHSAAALASMQISGPIVWTSVALLSAVTVGTVALVGRAVGAGDRALATGAARGSLVFAAVAGSLVGVVGTLAMPLILALFFGAGPDVLAESRGYLTIFMPSMPVFLLSYTAAAILVAAGDTKTPFLVAAAGNVINLVVNWVLVFGHYGFPELGAKGAAVGSVVAMAFQAAVLLWLLSRSAGVVSFRGPGDAKAALRRMLEVSAPAAGERAVQQAGFLGFVMMIGALGATAMAANQALVSIEAICFMSAEGFGIAAAAVVAQRLGGQRPLEAHFAARAATGFAVLTLCLYAIAFLFAPTILLSAFTDDQDIVARALPVMILMAVAQPFMAFGMVMSHALRGAGETRAPFVVMVVGGLVVRLFATWLLAFPLGLGLMGIWIGSTLDWVVRALMLAWVFEHGRWRDVVV